MQSVRFVGLGMLSIMAVACGGPQTPAEARKEDASELAKERSEQKVDQADDRAELTEDHKNQAADTQADIEKDRADVKADRSKFEAEVKARLDKIDVRVREAEPKIAKAKTSAKTKATAMLPQIKEQRAGFERRRGDLPGVTQVKWKETKDGLDLDLRMLEQNVETLEATIAP